MLSVFVPTTTERFDVISSSCPLVILSILVMKYVLTEIGVSVVWRSLVMVDAMIGIIRLAEIFSDCVSNSVASCVMIATLAREMVGLDGEKVIRLVTYE
jgi:hypothetical protein